MQAFMKGALLCMDNILALLENLLRMKMTAYFQACSTRTIAMISICKLLIRYGHPIKKKLENGLPQKWLARIRVSTSKSLTHCSGKQIWIIFLIRNKHE